MTRPVRPVLRSLSALGVGLAVTLVLALLPVAAVLAEGDARVTVDSPPKPFPQNKQNEPGLAVDPTRPNILAAGANEELDLQPCPTEAPAAGPRCPFTEGVGISGIYFSFDGGASWTQPTYHGYSARNCTPDECTPEDDGPIGTLPRYVENKLVSDGDPALVFGPRPGRDGFAWANGSRLYYANIATNFPGSAKRDETFKGGRPSPSRAPTTSAAPPAATRTRGATRSSSPAKTPRSSPTRRPSGPTMRPAVPSSAPSTSATSPSAARRKSRSR